DDVQRVRTRFALVVEGSPDRSTALDRRSPEAAQTRRPTVSHRGVVGRPRPNRGQECRKQRDRSAGESFMAIVDTKTLKQAEALTGAAPKALTPQSCVLVIFGAAGDLSWRKLLPAVYNLDVDGVVPSHFAVVGFGLPAEGGHQGDPDEYIRDRAKDGISRFSRH